MEVFVGKLGHNALMRSPDKRCAGKIYTGHSKRTVTSRFNDTIRSYEVHYVENISRS